MRDTLDRQAIAQRLRLLQASISPPLRAREIAAVAGVDRSAAACSLLGRYGIGQDRLVALAKEARLPSSWLTGNKGWREWPGTAALHRAAQRLREKACEVES